MANKIGMTIYEGRVPGSDEKSILVSAYCDNNQALMIFSSHKHFFHIVESKEDLFDLAEQELDVDENDDIGRGVILGYDELIEEMQSFD